MNIIKYSIFESNKYRKYNDLLKNLGVMSDKGSINLDGMAEKIDIFLAKENNRDKFLKNYDKTSQIKIESKKFKVKDLKPSQSEVFLDHILSRMIVKDGSRDEILKGKLKDKDILISSDDHLIDGHHRWATAFILNPECELKCTKIDIPIKYALPIINAMIESSDSSSSNKIADYDINLFDTIKWKKKKLKNKIKFIMRKTIKKGVNFDDDNKKSDDIKTKKDFYSIINTDKPLKFIIENMKKINKPTNMFPDREDMPQLNKKEAKKLL